MTTTDRIELEMRIREAAMQLVPLYGKEGIQFFHSQFLSIAEEYADSYEHEKVKLETVNPLFQGEE